MRLVSFFYNDQPRIGALIDGDTKVVDFGLADADMPTDMLAFLDSGAAGLARAQAAVDAPPVAAILDRALVTLRAPVPRPGKIICIGLNYRDHAAESNAPIPEYPIVFSKYANAITGPGDPIVLPRISDQVDYEAELGVVIGTRAFEVAERNALGVVAGYMPVHDVSARDYQLRTSQWTIGKTFDTFAPCGPALVTADEVPDPQTLDIQLRIGDEVLQNSNTSNLIFTVQQLVAHLSSVMTLEPGDLIATGTPGGVGMARKPPRFLGPGDVVQIEIERLGILENPVVAQR